jgi:hypothetical protein
MRENHHLVEPSGRVLIGECLVCAPRRRTHVFEHSQALLALTFDDAQLVALDLVDLIEGLGFRV